LLSAYLAAKFESKGVPLPGVAKSPPGVGSSDEPETMRYGRKKRSLKEVGTKTTIHRSCLKGCKLLLFVQ